MELVSVYKNDNHGTSSKYSERGLDIDTYANKDQKLSYTESKARNHRGLSVGNKCVVLSTVCFGLMCIFLAAAIVVLHIKLMTEREVQATHMLQSSSRDQMEKDQLQTSFNSLNQKKLELETRVRELTAEKSQLQSNFNSLSQKKSELETRVKDLTTEKSQLQSNFNFLSQKKSELETRVKDHTAEKSQLQRNFSSLSQKKSELETRVKDLTAEKSQLQRNFNSLSQKKSELETRVKDLTAEKSQLQRNVESLSQKKLELESELRKLSGQGNGRLFVSTEAKSWSDSRQYCRDRGADLVIINTEKKQQLVSSLFKESVWIGLSDIQQEGYMKWVDNSPLKQGFWEKNEPNDVGGNEDCIELNPAKPGLNNWNDIPCTDKRKLICES